MRRFWLALAVPLLGSAAGCPFAFTNDEHCAAQAGDATCAAADPSTPYCALDGCGLYDEVTNRTGCVAEQPSEMSCYSPCGDKRDANSLSDCADATESTSIGPGSGTDMPSSSSSTGQPEDTTSTSDECGEGEWLSGETCEPCGEEPLCTTSDPAEREVCGCDFCMPVFDGISHTGCVPAQPNCLDGVCAAACRLPTDCAEMGCEHDSGLCGVLEPGRVYYVRGDDGSDNDAGGEDTPFETIGRAIEAAEDVSGENRPPTMILIAGGTYTESLEVADKRVILRRWGEDAPELTSAGDGPALVVVGSGNGVNSYVNAVGLSFVDSTGLAVRVEPNGRFFGDGIEMRDNGAGISIQRGNAFLRNSIITGTAGLVVEIDEQADFGIVASTIVENGPEPWFQCAAGTRLEGSIRDSILGNYDEPLEFADLNADCPLSAAADLENTVDGSRVIGALFDARQRLTEAAYDEAVDYALNEPFSCSDERGPSIAEPCRPVLDVDGMDRRSKELGNWVGASLPPPMR